MSSPTTSLVAISVADAKAAADAMIIWVNQKRKEQRESYIAQILTHKTRDGWFKPKRFYTMEEAIEMVEDRTMGEWGGFPVYSYWRFVGMDVQDLAERLTTAARLSRDGFIWVNLEDAQTIGKHLPEDAATT